MTSEAQLPIPITHQSNPWIIVSQKLILFILKKLSCDWYKNVQPNTISLHHAWDQVGDTLRIYQPRRSTN